MDESPWPLLCSVCLFSFALNFYSFMCKISNSAWLISLASLLSVAYLWWRDVVRESTFQGSHTSEVVKGLRLGVVMFILSEVMFFFSFFFAYFSISLCPDVELGGLWPPKGVEPLGYLGMPLFNTILLLSSGVSITWTHHCVMNLEEAQAKIGLLLTIFLGVVFTVCQGVEYYEASFSMADSVFGSLFFVMTGFHGIHVLVGSVFLSVSVLRLYFGHFSNSHHLGFEAAAWYWHFVDVVWLILYVSVYWWGSS